MDETYHPNGDTLPHPRTFAFMPGQFVWVDGRDKVLVLACSFGVGWERYECTWNGGDGKSVVEWFDHWRLASERMEEWDG